MRRPTIFTSLLIVTVVTIVPIAISAEQSTEPETGGPRLYCPYWAVGEGFNSFVFIRNNRVENTIMVELDLAMVDGRHVSLKPFPVAPRETFRLDLALTLAAEGISLGPLIEGAATISFPGQVDDEGFLKASNRVVSERAFLSFAFNFEPLAPEFASNELYGLWWRRDSETRLKLAVYNPGAEVRRGTLTLTVRNSRHTVDRFSLPPRGVLVTDLTEVLGSLGLESATEGGIALSFDGPPGGLVAGGVMLDPTKGLTAHISFFDPAIEALHYSVWRASYVPLGPPDPRLGLSLDSNFDTHAVIWNISAKPASAMPSFKYSVGEAWGRADLPGMVLAPGEIRRINLQELQKKGLLPADISWGSLNIATEGERGRVLVAVSSVDDLGRYVFDADPGNLPNAGFAREYWRANSTYDTLLAVENTTEQPTGFRLFITYPGMEEPYFSKPIEVQAGTTYLVDMKQLIRDAVPDSKGKTIPLDTTEGGMVIFPAGRASSFNVQLVAAGIPNPGGSPDCCYYTTARLSPLQITKYVGESVNLDLEAWSVCGATQEWSNLENEYICFYASGNGSVFSLSGDVANCVGVGTATLTGTAFDVVTNRICGTNVKTAGHSATGKPKITSISPPRGLIGATTSVTINGRGFGTNPTVNAGSGITVTKDSVTDTQIQARFAVATNAPAGNHTVTVTVNSQTSNSVNFYVQVPSKLVRFNYPPVAPGGVQALQIINDGNVLDVNGNVLLTHQCGVYRNYVYDVVDQAGQAIRGTYTFTYWFSDYQGPMGLPPPRTVPMIPDSLLSDTQYFGKNSRACLGPDEHESFKIHHYTTIGGQRYDLSTIVTISKGRYSGEYRVDGPITTP